MGQPRRRSPSPRLLHADFHLHGAQGSSDSDAFEKFERSHREWFARLQKFMGKARQYRLAYEDFNPPPGGAASARQEARSREGQEAVLFDLYNFFDVRMADRLCLIEHCASPALADRASYRDYLGLQTDGERLSRAVAARQKQKGGGQPSEARGRARAHPSSARGAERKSAEHQARVAWAAGLAFASVTLAGCCLALGVAIGQQHPWQRSRSSQDLAGAETPTRQVPLLSAETPTTPTQRRAPVSF